MKRAVIFVNGNRPSRDLVFETVKTTDTIICADRGAKHAIDSGITPHVILGDLDSLPKTLQKSLKKLPIEWHAFSQKKDFTDSELAMKYAVEKGFRDIVVIGIVGDRLDHMLANITHFSQAVKKTQDLSITIVEKHQRLYFVTKKLLLNGKKGQTLSILSLDGDAKGVSAKGLKWRLQDEVLHFGEPRGVSNEFVGIKALVRVEKGVLLVIHTYGK
ncbi:MAG: thiamine diphosphokinase [bacterium]|nr:thiamine diphosphokinase [bacterium]